MIPNSSPPLPTVNPPRAHGGPVLSLDEFQPAGEPRSDWAAMRAALAACKDRRASRLILPRRQYRFDDPEIARRGDPHIVLRDLSDLIIDGQGSEMLFHHILGAFRLHNCQRVVLRDFTIDWDINLSALGTVKTQPDGRRAILVDDRYPVAGRKLATAVSEYDHQSMRWRMNGAEIYYPKDTVELAPQLIHSPSFEEHRDPPHGQGSLRDGMHMVVRHWVYEASCVDFGGPGNEDIACEDITLYQSPGHAFVGYGCERGFRLSRIHIQRRRERMHPVSATADGSHFGATIGDIIIEDCDFSHMGDDSVNIHSTWMETVECPDRRTIRLGSRWFDWCLRLDPGDELKFCSRANLLEFGRARILSSEKDLRNKWFTITVDRDLPTDLKAGDFVANASRTSSRFLIRGNRFHDHRARGMLIQATCGVIENNSIRNVMGAAFMMTSDCNYWKEGYGCEDVIVRGNLIEGCNYARWERGPIGRHMGAVSLIIDTPSGIGDAPVHSRVLFEGNTVRDTPGLAFLIGSSRDVTLRENRIENANTEPFDGSGSAIGATADGTIMITTSTRVKISGNRLRNTRKAYASRIQVTDSCSQVELDGNDGF